MIALDTNVLSEVVRETPSAAVVTWLEAHHPDEIFTTAVNEAEIRFGAVRLPRGRRRSTLLSAVEDLLDGMRAHVWPFDDVAAVAYADLVRDRERAGRPIDGFDAQIAAICRVRNATLATRNTTDFEGTGISLVDPWTT
ncbi:MAG: type II toxin-antitoxin system VapC family toxin [Angustibacter sp.]